MLSIRNWFTDRSTKTVLRVFFRHGALWAVAMSLGLCVAGCGSGDSRPASAKVNGQVSHAGHPVTEGSVNFYSAETGNAGAGPLSSEGKYEISEGIPPGKYLVYVTPPRITAPPKPGEPPPQMKQYPDIPEKFRTEQSSGLSFEVKAGTNENVDFKLD